MKLTGESRRTRGKTCPSATLSTKNSTLTDPGTNPGLRGGRPAANRLSHGTAYVLGLRCMIQADHVVCMGVLNNAHVNLS
jgi:hypothetical protein